VIAVYTDQEWRWLCQAIGDPSLADDPKFATVPARKQHEDELDHIIEAWTTRLVPETVMHALQSAGVAAGIVSRAEDLDHDPQLRLRRHYLTFEHPAIGRHQVDALPFRLSKTPAKQYRHSPCLGEHNVYVCKEILGLSDEEYIELVTAGTFG
jgi:crotonobetainyl-CoA:carnitine CoA-transferase CaiB-like acyl-CoA transferase